MINGNIYKEDIAQIITLNIPWENLNSKTILISGATGMIGTALIDVLMERNFRFNDNIKIVAVSRSIDKARKRFYKYFDNSNFKFISHDINEFLNINGIDYIIHAASNTHPVQYSTDPVGTIMTNVIGTKNLLELAVKNEVENFLFLSSVEIYGENRGDTEKFSEDYLGYIDCNTLRAGYPESKRTGEALCNAYAHKYGIKTSIARLSRIYGATMLKNDSKAISQFIKKAINGEDIVLKSDGTQRYSFTYVMDAVSGILMVLLKGENNKVYNVSDDREVATLREIAELISKNARVNIRFEIPDGIEKAGYSSATFAMMDSSKLRSLGWECKNSLEEGIEKTIKILRNKDTLGDINGE